MPVENTNKRSIQGGLVTSKSITFNNTIENYVGRVSNSEGRIANTTVETVNIDFEDIYEPDKYKNAVGIDISGEEKTFWQKANAVLATGFTVLLALNDGAITLTEKIFDGAVWSTKLPFDLICFVGEKTISLVAPEYSDIAKSTTEKITGFFKDVIAFEIDGWIKDQYMSTKFAQYMNKASYIDYSGTTAKSISYYSEKIQTYIGAAISSKVWGGALAIMLGGCYGSGEQAEKLYQEDKDTSFWEEGSILFKGLKEAAKWFCIAKTVQGFSGGNAAGAGEGTGATVGQKAKGLLGEIKQNGFFKTNFKIFKTLFSKETGKAMNPFTKYLGSFMSKPENIVAVNNALNRNTADYMSGDKKITLSSILNDIIYSFTEMATGASGVGVSETNVGGSFNLPIWGIIQGIPFLSDAVNTLQGNIIDDIAEEQTEAFIGNFTSSQSVETIDSPNDNFNIVSGIVDSVSN